jgi:predicted N-acyltransferase
MSSPDEITVKIMPAIREIKARDWDALANPDAGTFNPFVAHGFLHALEASGAVGREAGWIARHLAIEEPDGTLTGAAACYIKTHSQGEYVFDHAWADAYMRAGGRYYPKLQIAVPFTPVPGPRLLVRPGPQAAANEQALGAAAIELAAQAGFSSVHATFISAETQKNLASLGYLARTGQQFHWHNPGFSNFDDFLGTLASRKRKMVRKERAEALSSGIEIETIAGTDITQAHWDAIFDFYMDTGNRKWGRPYLNRKFFSLLGEAMPERCLLVMAKRAGRTIAGALNMIGGDCLYGRYWGAIEHHPSLHFEVCYYQAIEYAIAHKLARVEAGAQGEHKLARGYLPVETYSAHWIADPALRNAIERYLVQERMAVIEENIEMAALGPYRKGQNNTEGS